MRQVLPSWPESPNRACPPEISRVSAPLAGAELPMVSGPEGSGKLLNYMAMALPTVSFDMPVNREYLGDLGVYARPGDSQDHGKGGKQLPPQLEVVEPGHTIAPSGGLSSCLSWPQLS